MVDFTWEQTLTGSKQKAIVQFHPESFSSHWCLTLNVILDDLKPADIWN